MDSKNDRMVVFASQDEESLKKVSRYLNRHLISTKIITKGDMHIITTSRAKCQQAFVFGSKFKDKKRLYSVCAVLASLQISDAIPEIVKEQGE